MVCCLADVMESACSLVKWIVSTLLSTILLVVVVLIIGHYGYGWFEENQYKFLPGSLPPQLNENIKFSKRLMTEPDVD